MCTWFKIVSNIFFKMQKLGTAQQLGPHYNDPEQTLGPANWMSTLQAPELHCRRDGRGTQAQLCSGVPGGGKKVPGRGRLIYKDACSPSKSLKCVLMQPAPNCWSARAAVLPGQNCYFPFIESVLELCAKAFVLLELSCWL